MTTTVANLIADGELINKDLVSPQLWKRLVNRIVKDEGVEHALAERIMDQAFGFLRLCAEASGPDKYSPSRLVDIGWHTLILYTSEYAAFCDRLAGRFIHHNPSDEPGIDYGTGNVVRTVEAMKRYGIMVDEPLWRAAATLEDREGSLVLAMAADCSSYCSGDSCAGGGGDGDSGCDHGGS